MDRSILKIKNLYKWFRVNPGLFARTKRYIKAVDNVSFVVSSGQTFGVVGESGCGKSTLGRTILRLLDPTGGKIEFEGRDVTDLNKKDWQKIRRNMQMIFQDSYASMNPRMRVGYIIEEPMRIHGIGNEKERKERIEYLLETVGLSKDSLMKYPHEFSGGQRQRIDIARALVLNPKLIVCDEPVSALDVSIQSQVINLLNELQEEFNLTYLFISHDLSVIRHICDNVAVMYLGRIVEIAPKNEYFKHPVHPYSKALLSAVPVPDPDIKREKIVLEGDVPSPVDPPSGCYFRTRCQYAEKVCSDIFPEMKEISSGHFVACHII